MLGLLRKPETVVPEEPPVTAPAIAIPTDFPKGSETVLVAEDEATIRTFMASVLTDLGYQVVEAADGEEALQMVRGSFAAQIDLLVTDIVMPRMSGKELVYRMGKLSPETKVVFCSGYPEQLAVRNGMIDPTIPFLQKPVTPAALAWKVRAVIDAAKADFDLEPMLPD